MLWTFHHTIYYKLLNLLYCTILFCIIVIGRIWWRKRQYGTYIWNKWVIVTYHLISNAIFFSIHNKFIVQDMVSFLSSIYRCFDLLSMWWSPSDGCPIPKTSSQDNILRYTPTRYGYDLHITHYFVVSCKGWLVGTISIVTREIALYAISFILKCTIRSIYSYSTSFVEGDMWCEDTHKRLRFDV